MARKSKGGSLKVFTVGGPALLARLNSAPIEIYRKVVRKTINRGTTTMRKAIIAATPIGTDEPTASSEEF